jgi:aquaporin Z
MPEAAAGAAPLHVLRRHWPEYAMEAALLGTFLFLACAFTVLYEHPASPVRMAIDSSLLRRGLMGLSMGATAIAIIYSPWGKQSGAHINPATTLTFLRLGKIQRVDAAFYVAAQFAGAAGGVLLARWLMPALAAHPKVEFAATLPGKFGPTVAFAAEVVITFVLMSAVLRLAGHPVLGRFTGICVGGLVALYITLEAPLSGMSMNPARSFGSALFAGTLGTLWIYFLAPPLGMLLAAEFFLWRQGRHAAPCAKLHHHNARRCIFCGANGGAVL